jgi:hypothetical protein
MMAIVYLFSGEAEHRFTFHKDRVEVTISWYFWRHHNYPYSQIDSVRFFTNVPYTPLVVTIYLKHGRARGHGYKTRLVSLDRDKIRQKLQDAGIVIR